MRFSSLAGWLEWQQGLHPQAIDLGLERVREVAQRLGVLAPRVPVITVGGTNGKGSCVAYLEAMLRAGGYRTGAYTSPHLLRYNERIRIDGVEIDDEALVAAFERVDAARADVSLTYFEFGTLAALDLFSRNALDVWVLEVGLGGRLDAVNVVDADCALISSVALDHTDWLGPDRESIGREKAGILRPGRPAVFAGVDVPDSVVATARALGAELIVAERDYRFDSGSNWSFEDAGGAIEALPAPAMSGQQQYRNAAGALAALRCLSARLPLTEDALRTGVAAARVAGRAELVTGSVEWVLDVAHNQESIQRLAEFVAGLPARPTVAVFAQMRRKTLRDVIEPMLSLVRLWLLLELPDPDARPVTEIAQALRQLDAPVQGSASARDVFAQAESLAGAGGRVLVFGSFRTVEEAMRWRQGDGARRGTEA